MTVFQFKPAARSGVGLFVGVAGGTGSGKTFSALRLARGIVGPTGKVAAIDTEARRMSHYSDIFKFDVADMAPPFRPERFAQAAEDAERAGYAAIVIDSFSLEWVGEGGVLEWHDELKGDDEKQNMRAWIKPKMAHKAMISSFLQRRIPIVFAMRAEEKIKVGPGGRPEPQGWTPIGDQRFMYELTTMITLANDAPGIVNYRLPHKIQEQHRAFFPEGKHIAEEAGDLLRKWANGDDIPKAEPTELDRRRDALAALRKRLQDAPAAVEDVMAEDATRDLVAWLLEHQKPAHAKLFELVNGIRRDLKAAA